MLNISRGAGKPGDVSLSNAPFGIFGSRLGDNRNAPTPASELKAAYRGVLAARKGTKMGLIMELGLVALSYMAADETLSFDISAYEAAEVAELIALGDELRSARGKAVAPATATTEAAPEAETGEEAPLPF